MISSLWCQDRWWWTLFYFRFSSLFYFYFLFSFNFLFLEQLGLGFISHAVTSVTNWWRSHKTDHETWEKEVEGTRTKWHHTIWTTYVGLMSYSWYFRARCTVVSMDHEVLVYKVDYFVLGTLSSSLMLFIYKSCSFVQP